MRRPTAIHVGLSPSLGFVAVKSPRRQHRHRGDRGADQIAQGLLPPGQRRTAELAERHTDRQHQPESRCAGPRPADHARDRTRHTGDHGLPDAKAGKQQRTHADAHCSPERLRDPCPPPRPIETAVQEHNRACGPEVRQADELQLADQHAETRDQRGRAHRPQGGPDGPTSTGRTQCGDNAMAQRRKGIHQVLRQRAAGGDGGQRGELFAIQRRAADQGAVDVLLRDDVADVLGVH
jgi:hypothetical protein